MFLRGGILESVGSRGNVVKTFGKCEEDFLEASLLNPNQFFFVSPTGTVKFKRRVDMPRQLDKTSREPKL
jgi:hypothetical protein